VTENSLEFVKVPTLGDPRRSKGMTKGMKMEVVTLSSVYVSFLETCTGKNTMKDFLKDTSRGLVHFARLIGEDDGKGALKTPRSEDRE